MPNRRNARASEMAVLTALLSKMLVARNPGSNRGKRNKGRQQQSQVPAGMLAPVTANKPSSRKKTRKNTPSAIGSNGSIRVKRCELFLTMANTTKAAFGGSQLIVPSDKAMTWLYGVSKSFDRIKWHHCRLYWKSAVGTMSDGLITFGVDYNSIVASSIARADVSALTPVYDGPVWQTGASILVPKNRLSTRNEYSITSKDDFDKTFGSMLYYCTGADSKTYGDVWIEYDVTLSGTRA